MKQFSILTILLCSLCFLHAQTKAIAFKSHSSSSNDFAAALENGDMDNSNFGLGPTPIIKTNKLDSVKYVSKNVAIMYTSSTYKNQYTNEISKGKPGKDTVYNHPLFSRQHSLDSIKRVLKTEYTFKNSIDSTQFIGFDNGAAAKEKKKKHKKSTYILPFFGSDNGDSAVDTNALLAFGLTIGFILPVALLLRKVYHNFKNIHPDAEQSFT